MTRDERGPSVRSSIAIQGEGDRLALVGALDIHTIAEARRSLAQWLRARKSRALDLEKLESLDTPGALLLCGLREKGVKLTGLSSPHEALLDLVCGLDLNPVPKPPFVPRWREIVIQIGKGT